MQGYPAVRNARDEGGLWGATAATAKNLDRLVEKGRLTPEDAKAVADRIVLTSLDEYRDCSLVIEAVIENLDAKRDLFAKLEAVVADDAILATNTSSLSIAAIARGCRKPERVI